MDLGIFKNFHITEIHAVQFRAEFFGATNTPQLGQPGATVNTPTFGRITTATDNRIIQFGLKYSF